MEIMLHILLVLLDLGGTFVFAISGGMAGARHRLDIFGILVLSFRPWRRLPGRLW
jgi:uncharacterized membrane protein YeiH